MKLTINNVLLISLLAVVLSSSSIIFYYNSKLSEQNYLFDSKLSSMSAELNDNLQEGISSLQNNLTTEIALIDTNLRNFKIQSQQEVKTINNLIDEIEKQSQIQLGELKDELKSIQVKSKDFTAIIDDVLPSVVSIVTDKAQGSGAIIDSEGFIVTNYHVVEGANIIRILTYSNKVYNAQLIGYNDEADVAVIKVNANLESLEFGDSDDVKVGEKVIALGNPAGLSFTVTEGIVSAVHRKGPNNLAIYLQTDVPINPGNSGGPLVDINSKIIGLNNFKVGGFEGLGFAIESNTVKQVAEQIINGYKAQIAQQ